MRCAGLVILSYCQLRCPRPACKIFIINHYQKERISIKRGFSTCGAEKGVNIYTSWRELINDNILPNFVILFDFEITKTQAFWCFHFLDVLVDKFNFIDDQVAEEQSAFIVWE